MFLLEVHTNLLLFKRYKPGAVCVGSELVIFGDEGGEKVISKPTNPVEGRFGEQGESPQVAGLH